jgi:hypothetical protein
MLLTAVHHHSAPADQVFRALTDPGLIGRRHHDLVGAPSCAVGPDGGTDVVVTRLVDVVDSLPQPIASPVLEIREHLRWDPPTTAGGREGVFSLEVRGAPLSVEGRLYVVPLDAGCDTIVEVEVSTTMRVLGGRLLAPLRRHVGTWIEASLCSVDAVLASEQGPAVDLRHKGRRSPSTAREHTRRGDDARSEFDPGAPRAVG